MCGIAGSFDPYSGYGLYKQNLSRGYYSSSVVLIHSKGYSILKTEGAFKYEDIPHGADYYLFHSRGPTVETNSFDWDDNHPFSYGRFLVAHNGIIENAETIYDGCKLGVDSRVIPWLADKTLRDDDCTSDGAIHSSLNQLQGTFGLYIFDTSSKDISIVRSDIALCYNASWQGIEFSSSNPGTFQDLPLNRIFKFNPQEHNPILVEGGLLKLTKKPKYFIAGSPKV